MKNQTAYHTCPIHGISFTGERCPVCFPDRDEWVRKYIGPDSKCCVCGKPISECENKGKKED